MTLIDPTQLCPDCLVVRTPRSRHCGTCNRCVERFDHHCPWINNCVGVKNHSVFMVFLICTVSSLMLVFGTTLYNFITLDHKYDQKLLYDFILKEEDISPLLENALQIFVLAFTCFFMMPLLLLIFV